MCVRRGRGQDDEMGVGGGLYVTGEPAAATAGADRSFVVKAAGPFSTATKLLRRSGVTVWSECHCRETRATPIAGTLA
jgi:hypothetical protein